MSGGEGGDRQASEGDEADTGPASARSAKWRCAWCEKPHERNDPPCDNCGHHKFERAVVPVAPDMGDDYQREPVWVCPECGRQHQKNSPPCSRCGHHRLEKHVPGDEDFAGELGGTSYVDLLEPRYVAGFAVALVALAALVLAALGVITLPGMDSGVPTVEDVPGSADSANGLSLADVETATVAALNDRRDAADADRLERNDRLDAVATYGTQSRVKAAYGEATTPSQEDLAGLVGRACNGNAVRVVTVSQVYDASGDEWASADALGEALATAFATEANGFFDGATDRTGLDVHVGPDGRLFLTVLVC